ncbi:hypothetical protein [uncultured phage MedDCM-OCT-S08-C239]|nr:hypothetical protein [uncultured phage MedDCM-OCT-S08-C239]
MSTLKVGEIKHESFTGTTQLKLDSAGRLLVGTTTEGQASADDLTIATTGNTGITVRSGTSNAGNIYFSDATSGTAEYAGYVSYSHSTNSLSFGTNDGSERMRIHSSGIVTVGDSGGSAYGGQMVVSTATGGVLTCADTGSGERLRLEGGSGIGRIGTDSNHDLVFITNGTSNQRMRIDSSGRVLIGVSASYANASIDELQIGNNNSSNQSGITIGSTDECAIAFADAGDARAGSITYNHGSDAMIFKINGQNEYFRVHTNGIKVNSASDAVMEMHTSNGTAHSRINFSNNNGDNTGGIWYSASNHMQFRTANDYQFVISATNGRLERSFGAGSSTDADGMWFNNDQSASGTFIRFWQTSGSYGANQIGSISHSANNTSYNTSSDYRLKENAVAISDGITRLKTLKPYRFNFISEPSKTVDGFFAHEAATTVPEAVTGTKDEVATIADTSIGVAVGDPVYQGIDQSKLVPLLVAAVQELTAKVEALEAG